MTTGRPVSLVIPPSPFLADQRVFVSLGILRVAAVLEQAGYPVEVLDLSGVENYIEATEYHARATDADVFGLTVTTPQLPAAVAIGARLRQVRPDARLILGGPHVTLVSAAVKLERKAGRVSRAHAALAKLHDAFDVLVAGDGELAIFRALAPDAPRLVDAEDKRDTLFLTDAMYDVMPLPARHLVDLASYHYSIDGCNATPMIAQLGCPFGCTFCGGRNSRSLRSIRTRTTDSIVGEVEMLHRDYGYTGVMLFDDELNVSPSMVELMNGIADLQGRLGVEFRLRGFVKAELFNDAQAAAMHRAGFRWILCGYESGSPRILKNINKRATRDDNTRCVEMARRHGLKVKALMSLGHPGESAETVEDTKRWLLEVRPDDFDATIITTYPGTPYYDAAIETAPGTWTYTINGDRLHSEEVDYTLVADFYKGVQGEYVSHVFTDALSAAELVTLRDALERDVRAALGIRYNAGAPGVLFEASMGQLPGAIFRRSEAVTA